jgi:hypothetical protein
MLEFVRELFVRMPPNTTSWCDTLEIFLGKRSYKLTTRVGFIKFNEVQFLNSLTRTLYDVDSEMHYGGIIRWSMQPKFTSKKNLKQPGLH